MKKRTGVERAVIVMAVVVVLLAIALIVVNAAGIRIHKPAPEAPAATNLPQFPFSDEPELILGSGQAPSRDAQQAVSVGGEDKTMQLVTGSFAQRGGPDFSLYLDTSVFLSTEMDGKCCFARADDASMDAYLEIGYHPGADAQTLAGTILNDYGTIANDGDARPGQARRFECLWCQWRHGAKTARGIPDPDGGRLRFGRALPGRNGAGRLV